MIAVGLGRVMSVRYRAEQVGWTSFPIEMPAFNSGNGCPVLDVTSGRFCAGSLEYLEICPGKGK